MTSDPTPAGLGGEPAAERRGHQRRRPRHTTPVSRIEADTEADNVAERRALEKCGFTQEGVMRGRTFRAGAWRDIVRYAILRDDPLPPL
ncbi:GNAT family protein [Streptomyces sp. NPDC048442]|uniref:GNAT family N-acetyltransferase n=1 Tax=Streptomyces sp. NPDC048442 TaxID=3154823 RepID=UPI003429AAC8